jgi:hypothetical protein
MRLSALATGKGHSSTMDNPIRQTLTILLCTSFIVSAIGLISPKIATLYALWGFSIVTFS